MAKSLFLVEENPIGKYVYKPYHPQVPGKIISLEGQQAGVKFVKVKWLTGKITDESSLHLNDFSGLIADHEKKLQTHKNKLEELIAFLDKE